MLAHPLHCCAGMRIVLTVTLLSSLLGACSSAPASGEFPDEDLPDSPDGKSDGGGLFTYYRTVLMAGGGYGVARVNQAETLCPDGMSRAVCAIDGVDFSLATDLGPAELAQVKDEWIEGTLLFHGHLSAENGPHLLADEVYRSLGYADPAGVFVHMYLNPDCAGGPDCAPYVERKLNSARQAERDDFELAEDSFMPAYAGVASTLLRSHAGALVAGSLVLLDGKEVRTVTVAYQRVVAREQDGCVIACDGSVCAPSEAEPTCEDETFTCATRFGTCTPSENGCAWQSNDQTQACEASGGL
jgi:hypothetical protein